MDEVFAAFAQAPKPQPAARKPASPPAKKPISPKQEPARRRTMSDKQPPVQASKPVEEPKQEISPPSTKTPTPLPMELEIATFLTQELPRSNSNTGTAKSLTSSPTRRSPVKATPIAAPSTSTLSSAKKANEKVPVVKKVLNKVKKDTPAVSSPTEKRQKSGKKSEGISREVASLFDDNKFMASSMDGEESPTGRPLRHRVQIKKEEEKETPAKSTASTSAKAPQTSNRKRVSSQNVS